MGQCPSATSMNCATCPPPQTNCQEMQDARCAKLNLRNIAATSTIIEDTSNSNKKKYDTLTAVRNTLRGEEQRLQSVKETSLAALRAAKNKNDFWENASSYSSCAETLEACAANTRSVMETTSVIDNYEQQIKVDSTTVLTNGIDPAMIDFKTILQFDEMSAVVAQMGNVYTQCIVDSTQLRLQCDALDQASCAKKGTCEWNDAGVPMTCNVAANLYTDYNEQPYNKTQNPRSSKQIDLVSSYYDMDKLGSCCGRRTEQYKFNQLHKNDWCGQKEGMYDNTNATRTAAPGSCAPATGLDITIGGKHWDSWRDTWQDMWQTTADADGAKTLQMSINGRRLHNICREKAKMTIGVREHLMQAIECNMNSGSSMHRCGNKGSYSWIANWEMRGLDYDNSPERNNVCRRGGGNSSCCRTSMMVRKTGKTNLENVFPAQVKSTAQSTPNTQYKKQITYQRVYTPFRDTSCMDGPRHTRLYI